MQIIMFSREVFLSGDSHRFCLHCILGDGFFGLITCTPQPPGAHMDPETPQLTTIWDQAPLEKGSLFRGAWSLDFF